MEGQGGGALGGEGLAPFLLGGRRRQFRTRSSYPLTHFCLLDVRAAAVVHDGLVGLRYKTVECCGACIAVLSSLGLRMGLVGGGVECQ